MGGKYHRHSARAALEPFPAYGRERRRHGGEERGAREHDADQLVL